MRRLGFLLFLLLALNGCASVEPRQPPLSAQDVIDRSKAGVAPKEIIAELFRTNTVLPANAAELVRLHEAGVSNEVLDYLQYAQLQELRWRDHASYWYGPGFYRGFGPCPFPGRRPYRSAWGC